MSPQERELVAGLSSANVPGTVPAYFVHALGEQPAAGTAAGWTHQKQLAQGRQQLLGMTPEQRAVFAQAGGVQRGIRGLEIETDPSSPAVHAAIRAGLHPSFRPNFDAFTLAEKTRVAETIGGPTGDPQHAAGVIQMLAYRGEPAAAVASFLDPAELQAASLTQGQVQPFQWLMQP